MAVARTCVHQATEALGTCARVLSIVLCLKTI
jgi:hypothetical protein